MRLKLNQTCGACPEQYDVYDEAENYVAYFRLRHGSFRAELADGTTVYEACPRGDGLFEPEERTHYLNAACQAVKDALANGSEVGPTEPEPEYDLIDITPER